MRKQFHFSCKVPSLAEPSAAVRVFVTKHNNLNPAYKLYVSSHNSYPYAVNFFDYPEVWSPASSKMSAGNFPEVKRQERDADHPPTSRVAA